MAYLHYVTFSQRQKDLSDGIGVFGPINLTKPNYNVVMVYGVTCFPSVANSLLSKIKVKILNASLLRYLLSS